VIDYIKKLDDMKKISRWWIDGQNMIGGSLGLFLSMPIERIEEFYNIKF